MVHLEPRRQEDGVAGRAWHELPPRFRRSKQEPTEADYIHDGMAAKLAAQIIPLDITRWLQAHPTWKGGQRTRIQAVKRAFNYAVERAFWPAVRSVA